MSATRATCAFFAAIGLSLSGVTTTLAEDIAVSAGAKGGAFYRAGHAICRLLNRKVTDIKCSVSPLQPGDAGESFANIVNLRDGAVEIGIARSDWQYFAYTGTGPVKFMHTKFDTLRSLFSIDTRPFTLLVKRDGNISGLDGLKRRRVNLGTPHSDPRKIMELLMAAKGWSASDFALAESLPPADQSLSFCHDWVEVIYYVTGQPDATVRRVTELCNAVIVPVAGPAVDKLVAETPYLTDMAVPGGIYAAAPNPVKTFGTTITVMTSSEVSEDLVYALVKAVFENLGELQDIYPGLRQLGTKQMLTGALSAPLHGGAERYFREQGLL